MTLLISLIGGVLGSFFGWAGGRGDDYWIKNRFFPRWILQSWVRDWLIGPLCVLVAFIFGVHSWWLLLVILLTAAALSTYWDFMFGFDNFWFHGFVVGLAAAPIAYASGHWFLFILRTLLLAVWMGGWSSIFKNPHIEEAGRYFIVPSTLFMIC